jgi:hypothetical protein
MRSDRQHDHACFAMAKQQSAEWLPRRLVLVRSGCLRRGAAHGRFRRGCERAGVSRNSLSLNLATECGAGLESVGPDSRGPRPNAHVARLLGGRGDYLALPTAPLNDADAVAFLQPGDGTEPKRAEERRGG